MKDSAKGKKKSRAGKESVKIERSQEMEGYKGKKERQIKNGMEERKTEERVKWMERKMEGKTKV